MRIAKVQGRPPIVARLVATYRRGVVRTVGRYEILREIGRGGMAIVYAARQPDLDRQVALKELSRFHASSAEFAHRFLRESRLAGSLNHPNIVTVHEYFEHDVTPYIAMELVPRGSLRRYVKRLSFAQMAGVLEGVLAGLAHAETAGIVHRDLKPENVMVTSEGRVKITDFGIARATQRAGTQYMTATGMTVGTPSYMAPEQAMAGEIGPWTDLYSVGILTYELLLGSPPFSDSDTPVAILMRHVNERVRSPIELQPTLDPGLSDWIDSLLVKDPLRRVRHALDAWESLEDIVVRLLGPLWRRDARLLTDHADAVEADPLTPAPFESQPAIRTPTPRPADLRGQFVTFDRGPAAEPEPVPEPEPIPEPEPVPEPDPDPVAEVEPDPVAEVEPDPGAEVEPDPGAEVESDLLAEPEPLAVPEPEPTPRLGPASVPSPTAASRRRGASVLVATVVAVLAAAVGFIVAPASRGAPPSPTGLTRTASTDRFSISYPSAWRPAVPPASALHLSSPIALVPRRGGGTLIVGTTASTDATLLPGGFPASLLSPPQGATVRLGASIYRRYLNLLPRDAAAPETVYALPTTAGTLIASCLAPTSNATVFAATCERAVASLRLKSATALPLSASPAFARALGQIVRTLNAARDDGGHALAAAKHPTDQAAAARRLALAHNSAATAAGRLAPGPVGAQANRAIVATLHQLGSAYKSLGHAAEHNDKRQYAAASAAIARSDGALTAAFARLRQDGYSIG